MERTAWAYPEINAADMTVIADYEIDQANQEELPNSIRVNVEFGYMTDLTLAK